MRAMAQLADTWRDTAERAIDILDSLEPDNNANGSMSEFLFSYCSAILPGKYSLLMIFYGLSSYPPLNLFAADLRLRPQPPPPTQLAHTPSRQSNNRLDTFQSPEGSVIAPSHSASQVARRAAGIPADFSDDEGDTALGGHRDTSSLHRSASMNDGNHIVNGSGGAGHNRRSSAATNPPIAEVSHEEEMASGGDGASGARSMQHQQQRVGGGGGGGASNNNRGGGRIEEDEEEGGGSSEDERGHELDPKLYQVHVNKPLTPRELAQQKARQLMAQKQADEKQMIQPQGGQAHDQGHHHHQHGQQQQQQYSQQQQQQQHYPQQQQQQQYGQQEAVQQAAAPARKRTSSTPIQAPPAQQQQQGIPTRTTSPYKETPEDRQKRFSTLTTTTIPAYDAATAPIAIPSAGTFTLESYKKKNAPEATLLLPSATGLKGYQATRSNDSDDEAVDEVGALGRDKSTRRRTASTPGRPSHGRTFSNESESVTSDGRGERRTLKTNRLPSGRDSAYYSRSDAGTSTLRGGEKRQKEKHRNDGHHKSSSGGGGFFGAIGGLFKKRDLQSRSYGDDDDDDDSVLGSPKSRGTRTGGERNSSIWGGSSKKKDRKSRIMEDSDSDAPDPRTLIKVQNNAGRGRALGGGALSDIGVDRQTEAAIRAAVNSNTFSSVGPDRKKAMSDVGAPRAAGTTGTVKKKKKVVASPATSASPVSQATTLQPTPTVKKKKKVVSSTSGGPTTTAVANNLAPATSGLPGTMMIVSSSSPNLNRSSPNISRSNTMTLPSPAQRVTRDTPSLMSVVAPPSQSSRVMNMPLPSAKNPSLSATPKTPSSPTGSALGVPDQPLKKKKTVKKSSTSSNINGNLVQAPAPATASTLRASATTPNLLAPGSAGTLKPAVKASSAVGAPRPASILSVGSGAGGNGGSTLGRRKSVRLASDTKINEAKYENSGPPANIPRVVAPPPVTNGTAAPQQGILKESNYAAQTNHNVHDYTDTGVTTGAGVGEWSTRVGRDDDVSSDEGGDEYARIKHELGRAERSWKDAGFMDKGKGKARAY